LSSIRDSTFYERWCAPYLLRSNNLPGKPLPLTGWAEWAYRPPRLAVSGSLGLYTLEVDSCWLERTAEIGRLCVPKIFVMDTLDVRRASFSGARGAAWSPDGKRLAFINVRVPSYFNGSQTIIYREIHEGVSVFDPSTGDLKTFPTPTDVLSWIDSETVMLENQGRRYGLSTRSGHTGSSIQTAINPIMMLGVSSPDQAYIYRPGTLKYWSLWGHGLSDCLDCPRPDSTEPGREGIDMDLSSKLQTAIGGTPASVSGQSFWVRNGGPGWMDGQPHAHDLCLGVTWKSEESKCEVLIVDVHRGVVTRRIEGSLIGPAADATCGVVLQGRKVVFISLSR